MSLLYDHLRAGIRNDGGRNLPRQRLKRSDSRAFPKEVKSMKRKITGAILISLGLGLFWQALAEGLDCQTRCRESYVQCTDLAHKSIDPIRSLKICNDTLRRCLGNCVN